MARLAETRQEISNALALNAGMMTQLLEGWTYVTGSLPLRTLTTDHQNGMSSSEISADCAKSSWPAGGR